jgi:hypothetical protein
MRKFAVTTEGQNRLGFVDEQWVAVHLPADQAAESVPREFKRAVRTELELLEVRCQKERPPKKKRTR